MSIGHPPLALNAWLRYDLVSRITRRIERDAPVLEIGAGQGAVGSRLAERFDYVGVEADPTSAAVARRRIHAHGGTLVQGDARDVAPVGPYDLVCAFEVLEHIEDDSTALGDWIARLRVGGRLLISVPAHQHRFGPWDTAVGHYRRYGLDELTALLRAGGLGEVQVYSYGFPLGYVLEAVRNRIAARGSSPASAAEATAGSGRRLQPSGLAGVATRLLSAPFRYLQRPFASTGLGTGLVATGIRRGP